MHDCQEYRAQALVGALEPSNSAGCTVEVCAECASWHAQVTQQVQLLQGLPTLELPKTHAEPDSLGAAFASEERTQQVELDERIERALTKCSLLQAPMELSQRVEHELEQSLPTLASVESQGSPSVLDRLVDEELAAPLGHQAARSLGRLARLDPPTELIARVEEELVSARSDFASIRWGGWLTFLAACLVGWIAIRSSTELEPETGRRLTIVKASSLSELSPAARSHMEVLGGGFSSLVPGPTKGNR